MQLTTNIDPFQRTMRFVIVALIVVSTVLFIVGVVIEHSRQNSNVQATTTQEANIASVTATPVVSGEAGEGQGHVEGSAQSTSSGEASHAQEGTETHSETVLGINIENPWIVTAFVIGWLVLLIALFMFGRWGLLAVMLAAIAALIFDVGEVSLQFGMSDTVVGVIAVVVAVAHAVVAALSLWLLARD